MNEFVAEIQEQINDLRAIRELMPEHEYNNRMARLSETIYYLRRYCVHLLELRDLQGDLEGLKVYQKEIEMELDEDPPQYLEEVLIMALEDIQVDQFRAMIQ